jgi:hypothetical protein
MPKVKFTKREVRGKDIDIYVVDHPHKGTMFIAEIKGEEYDGETVDDLVKKLLRATKRKISVEVFVWREREDSRFGYAEKPAHLRRGICIGRHAGNGNLLIRWDGEKSTEQVTRWHGFPFLQLTEEEQKQYAYLQKVLDEAKSAVSEFESTHTLDLEAETEVGED